MWHTYIYNYLHVCANLWMWIRWVTGSCSALPLLRNWSSMNLPKRLELSFLALRNTDVTWNTWCHICHLNHNEDVLCWAWFGFCVFWCFIVVCWPTSFLLQYPQKRLRLSVRAFPNASSSGLDSNTCFSTWLWEEWSSALKKALFCSINSSETATDLQTVEVGALVTSPSAAPAIARNFLKTHEEQICGSTGCALWSKGSESEAFQGTIVIQNDQVHQGFLTSLYKSFKSWIR